MATVIVPHIPAPLAVPQGFELVESRQERRDGTPILLSRYQPSGPAAFDVPHVSVVTHRDGRHLISFRAFSSVPSGPLPGEDDAIELTLSTFDAVDPGYARRLSPLRVERQVRDLPTADGTEQISVLWVKLHHRDDFYNWVTVGPGGRVVELEREVRWDYLAGRRGTEMWDDDRWLLAREGKGPQLPSPAAHA